MMDANALPGGISDEEVETMRTMVEEFMAQNPHVNVFTHIGFTRVYQEDVEILVEYKSNPYERFYYINRRFLKIMEKILGQQMKKSRKDGVHPDRLAALVRIDEKLKKLIDTNRLIRAAQG